MDVGDVQFDQPGSEFRARVPQDDRRVGQSAGVEDHRFTGVGGVVDPAEQFGLAVRLPHDDLDAEFLCGALTQRDEVVVGGGAVDLRLLTFPETAEVRAVGRPAPSQQHRPPLGLASRAIAP